MDTRILVAFGLISLVVFLVWFVHRLYSRRNRRNLKFRDINGVQTGIEADDDMMADVIAATIRTGLPHVANRADSGEVTISPLRDGNDNHYDHHDNHHDDGGFDFDDD